MGVVDRLRRLEQGSRSCTECGQPSNFTHDATYVDSYQTYQGVYESGPEFCPECGLRVLHPVYFHLEKAATTLPVMIVRARPKHGEEYADGN